MLNMFATHWAPCQLLSCDVYRADSRPPSEILLTGFSGTQATYHTFAAFEQQTVFASLTLAGACRFRQLMEEDGLRLPYVYRINARGIRGYIFNIHHSGRDHFRNSQRLAQIDFERRPEFHTTSAVYQWLGHQRYMNHMVTSLADAITHGFLQVDEVHLQGPIVPEKIRPDFCWTTEDLMQPRSAPLSCRRRNFF